MEPSERPAQRVCRPDPPDPPGLDPDRAAFARHLLARGDLAEARCLVCRRPLRGGAGVVQTTTVRISGETIPVHAQACETHPRWQVLRKLKHAMVSDP